MEEPDQETLALLPHIFIRIRIENPNKDPGFLNQVPTLGAL